MERTETTRQNEPPDRVDVFLAGIIQGSQAGQKIESQSYRDRLKEIFARELPKLDVYCPFEHHQESIDYDDDQGRRVFLRHLEMCRHARLLVAYLPTASLGTAIEIWECHRAGVPIVAISPMNRNWVLRFFTQHIFPDLEAFASWLSADTFGQITSAKT